MRVFLTGATGFIGSHVARLLLEHGVEVHALVRATSDPWRIADVLPALHIVPYDLEATDELEADLAGIRPDICIHSAWYAEPGRYVTSPRNTRMLSVSMELAAMLARCGCRRFVGIGTCAEYGSGGPCLGETHALRPHNLYAASKAALYLVLEQLGPQAGMEFVWLRLFYQYGPLEDERRLMPYIITRLLDDQPAEVTAGEQVRDYLHVQDVASAIWAAATSGVTGPVNVGSGQPVMVRDIVAMLGSIMERPHLVQLGARPTNPEEPHVVYADNRRLRETTSWSPSYDIAGGLRQTVEWWRQRKVGAI